MVVETQPGCCRHAECWPGRRDVPAEFGAAGLDLVGLSVATSWGVQRLADVGERGGVGGLLAELARSQTAGGRALPTRIPGARANTASACRSPAQVSARTTVQRPVPFCSAVHGQST